MMGIFNKHLTEAIGSPGCGTAELRKWPVFNL